MAKPNEEPRRIWGDDDDDDAPRVQRQCVDCKALAPLTSTSHSLISSKHGWRLQRSRDAQGSIRLEWLCARCAVARRARGVEAEALPESGERAKIDMPEGTARTSALTEDRASRSVDMVSNICRALRAKLDGRRGPRIERLLWSVAELEREIEAAKSDRRAELWSALLSLNREAEELIASGG
jgi:hypothetical protein